MCAQKITKCIFCGGRPLSAEDYYPNWAKRQGILVGEHAGTITRNSRRSFDPDAPQVSEVEIIKKRQDPIHQTLKVVCAKCNNGWMSRLQTAAQPTLVAMSSGRWPRFAKEELDTVAAWATMHTMVTEFWYPEIAAATAEDRQLFMSTQRPPPGWVVGICLYHRPTNHARWHRAITAVSPADGTFIGAQQATVFSFAGLLFQVIYRAPSLGLLTAKFMDAYSTALGIHALWPRTVDEIWQPTLCLDDAGVILMARQYWELQDIDIDAPPSGFATDTE